MNKSAVTIIQQKQNANTLIKNSEKIMELAQNIINPIAINDALDSFNFRIDQLQLKGALTNKLIHETLTTQISQITNLANDSYSNPTPDNATKIGKSMQVIDTTLCKLEGSDSK